MNKDIFAGKWHQLKGKVKEEWGDLTDDEVNQVNGQAEQLAGRLQEKYGWSKDEAERKVDDFIRRHNV